jgi:hypothetical protein
MMIRWLTVAFAGTVVSVAHAQVSYTVDFARITFNTNEVSDLSVLQSGPFNERLDFTAGSLPLTISSNDFDGRTSALIEIQYIASSTLPIIGVGLAFNGWAFNAGRVVFRETIFDMQGILLGSWDETRTGELLGGTNSPFTRTGVIGIAPVENYRVLKTISLSFDQGFGLPSQASIGVIEQNAVPVPEPASLAALGLGALALARRRRR